MLGMISLVVYLVLCAWISEALWWYGWVLTCLTFTADNPMSIQCHNTKLNPNQLKIGVLAQVVHEIILFQNHWWPMWMQLVMRCKAIDLGYVSLHNIHEVWGIPLGACRKRYVPGVGHIWLFGFQCTQSHTFLTEIVLFDDMFLKAFCVLWRHKAAIGIKSDNGVWCRLDIHDGCIWNYNCGSCFSVGDGLLHMKLKWCGLCLMCCTVVVGSMRWSAIIITGDGCSSVHHYYVIGFVIRAVAVMIGFSSSGKLLVSTIYRQGSASSGSCCLLVYF